MPPKRKTRNLPAVTEREKINQMSFFDPVYQADSLGLNPNESDSEFSSNNPSRQSLRNQTNGESSETLDAYPVTKSKQRNETEPEEPPGDISVEKITTRINQIQYSLHQAQQMLESMEKFQHLVPGTQEQAEKLRVIVANLEEQKAGYVNLLNLITLTNQEREELLERISASQRQMSATTDEQSNAEEEEEEEDDDDEENVVPSRRLNQSPMRPRIESKIGFTPHPPIPPTPTVPPTIHSSDTEQNNRHDNSNYDSLVGSLKSDTINWKDQQLTSDDDVSEGENEKEIERNLMLQKEQLRALQGQKRALLALKKRSEQRLVEQQQQLLKQKPADEKENDLLGDINNLRGRLQLLRNLYDQKQQVEVQQMQSSSKKPPSASGGTRTKNLQHVREQLDELEKIVNYYQLDLTNSQEEEQQQTVYEETPMQPDDAQRLKTLIIQQRQHQTSKSDESKQKPLDKLSSELAAKRLELEQAKSALSRLQQMVKTIEPNESSSSIRSTPTPSNASPQKNNPRPSLLSSILSTQSPNNYADAKMAAQHREIERLIESRQRLHTLKDQISSLHQTMVTPPIQTDQQKLTSSLNQPANTYSRNNRTEDDDEDDELSRSECDSGDGEEIDDETDEKELFFEESQPRMKQGNFHAPEDIVAEHEQNLLTQKSSSNEELSSQMREICRCLSTFIQEQKSFNRHIEEHLSAATSAQPSPRSTTNLPDPVFNQLQQQVLTQGLIVNLNTAYREIAVLQSEINALQTENTRLTSSLSSRENQYHSRPQTYSRADSKDSMYSLDQIKPIRSRFDEQHPLLASNKFENSSKTSFNSQSTGQQTAIHCEKQPFETTPIKHSTERYASPTAVHLLTKENHSKSFVIRRRPLSETNQPSVTQSQLFNYDQATVSDDEDDDEDEDDEEAIENEQQMNDLSKTIFNIQPSVYYTSTTQDLDSIDIQTFDLQIKSIMIQLIPFMRLHINDMFNQSTLNHIRERIIFLFKQQPDFVQLIRQFQDQFSESLGKAIEKYCGTNIRDCANDLIRDISDVIFEELVKYKTYESTASNQANNLDDGENENKYQIELAESESRPLNLIGSDEEDNDSDQEENKDSELETAVSRQESNLNPNENVSSSSSSELHSNGHEYILVNRSSSQDIVEDQKENEDKTE